MQRSRLLLLMKRKMEKRGRRKVRDVQGGEGVKGMRVEGKEERSKGCGFVSIDKGKPALVVDGSSKDGFKKWRKNTIHPIHVTKRMTAAELLVRE